MIIRTILPLVWAALIFFLSSIPSTQLPQAPGGMSVLVHFVEYGVLAYLVYRAVLPLSKFSSPLIVTAILSGMYALSDEVHQLFVPGRRFSGADIFVDFLGIVCVLFVVYLVMHRKKPTE